MKIWKCGLAALAWCLPMIGLAGDGIFGTKASPMPTAGSQAPVGVFPVVQMLVALAVVLALLKWVMPLVVKRFGNQVTSSGNGIRIQETASFGQANLAVVVVRGKTLFLGATSSGVSCLADLTAVEKLPPTFQEILETAEPKENDLSDLASQLERLRRIGG